jgi:antirestriction protein
MLLFQPLNTELENIQEILANGYDEEAVKAFINWTGINEEEVTLEEFQSSYQGEYDSEEDFIEEYLDGLGILDQAIKILGQSSYIDYEAIATDYFIDDFCFESGYVFLRNY